jgi:hypothetical protein
MRITDKIEITKEERDIMILLINNLPCDEH